MTSRTNSPSEAAHGTARLPNPSTTLSKEVEEVAALLNEWPRDNRDAENWLSAQALMHTTADLLTRISAERDEIVQALAFRGNVTSDKDRLSWCVAIAIDTFRAAAERAEAERDALKARAVEVLEPFAKVAAQYEGCDADSFTSFGWKVFRFRRAAELHATISGEQK